VRVLDCEDRICEYKYAEQHPLCGVRVPLTPVPARTAKRPAASTASTARSPWSARSRALFIPTSGRQHCSLTRYHRVQVKGRRAL